MSADRASTAQGGRGCGRIPRAPWCARWPNPGIRRLGLTKTIQEVVEFEPRLAASEQQLRDATVNM
jgi:hypothetical protein